MLHCALQLDVISVLFFCKKSLLARHAFALFERTASMYNMYNMHVWIVRMLFKRAQGTFFFKKHGFLGLTPVYSETTALNKPYFILKLQSVKKFLRKRLLFKKQKVDSTGYYGV